MLSHRSCGVITAAPIPLSCVGAGLPTGTAAQQHSHHLAGHPAQHHMHQETPQHGRGGHDADTSGRPSDGDGNV
jgi:hypothetical protein